MIRPLVSVQHLSKMILITFRKSLHGTKNAEGSSQRVTPLKVLSRRPGELLCVVSEDTCEWLDVEEDSVEFSEIELESSDDAIPIIKNVSEWLKTPFTES